MNWNLAYKSIVVYGAHLAVVAGLSLFLLLPVVVLGQGETPVITNPTSLGDGIEAVNTNIVTGDSGLASDTTVAPILARIIKWLLALSAMLALGALVWGGIMYIMALGDEGKAGKAKQIIMYAVIGVTVVLLSYVILKVVQTTLTTTTLGQVNTAYAADTGFNRKLGIIIYLPERGNGFNKGLSDIDEHVKPGESGLATGEEIAPYILKVVNTLLGLVAVLALAALIWGSIMYILALGDEGRAEKAKKIILYAIIGVLLAGASYLILNVLKALLTS